MFSLFFLFCHCPPTVGVIPAQAGIHCAAGNRASDHTLFADFIGEFPAGHRSANASLWVPAYAGMTILWHSFPECQVPFTP